MMPRRHQRRRPAAERGSAYLVALLVLVLLTIFGLSLAIITQTEVQIGRSEKALTRVFYASDSGLAISVARLMTTSDPVSKTIALNDRSSGGLTVGDSVLLSPLFPVNDAPCNLCSINQDDGGGMRDIQHVLSSTAQRRATQSAPAGQLELANKQLSMLLSTQPRPSNILALRQVFEATDPNEQIRLKRLVRY